MRQSIDISWMPGPQQQTRRNSVLQPNDGTEGRRDGRTDRQTDRQTDGQQFRRPCCACYGSSVNNCQERTTYASRMRRIFFSLGPRWTVSRTRSWCGVRREAARCLLAKNSENHHRQFVTVIVPRHDFISTL